MEYLANGRDAAALNGGVGAEEATTRRKKVEMVQEVIHGFLEKRRGGPGGEEGSICQRDEEERLLSSLLTKLDELEKNADSDVVEPHSMHPNRQHPGNGEQSKKVPDIAKDLDKIKRQNTITHLLLGTVIVLTAVWQVNEVSFLLWLHNKLSNPFKSLGDMIKGSLKLRGRRPVMESSPLPPVAVPDISRADLPTLVIGGTEDT
ncbi:hypothetical protein BS78_04G141500 [Paspalum vaginatum]|nr:hypothetical protein BS78_04G141500 [Paspalum vaginatum]